MNEKIEKKKLTAKNQYLLNVVNIDSCFSKRSASATVDGLLSSTSLDAFIASLSLLSSIVSLSDTPGDIYSKHNETISVGAHSSEASCMSF